MREIKEILAELDADLRENRIADAENLLLQAMDTARKEDDQPAVLQLANELMGFYRELSEGEKMLQAIGIALQASEQLNLAGTIPYATTLLNAANAYRSIGELDRSMEYYKAAAEVYGQLLPANDMLMASLYNNISLLYQEKQDYAQAEQYLLMALPIVKENEEAFEIAVTYANLANTAVMAKRNETAEEYAQEAIRRFREIDCLDAHYASALSALGMCLFCRGRIEEAATLFREGMDVVETCLGQNEQYMRLKSNYDVCVQMQQNEGDKPGQDVQPAQEACRGLQLAKQYYETYGKPMVDEQFSAYASRIAVGLAGEGSDCFGYDDDISRDHDWGPGFCMWVTDETYEAIGEQLQAAYERLPQEFLGFRRADTAQGAGRRGVIRISEFYRRLVGAERYEEIDWRSVADYSLAAAVNGEVFRDEEGIFTAMRQKLQQGYPRNIQYLKLAEDVAGFSQCGQYNYLRMLERQDTLTADMMLTDCIRHVMRMKHHICNLYPPHEKWLYRSFSILEGKSELSQAVEQLHGLLRVDGATAAERSAKPMEQCGSLLARELYQAGFISDVDSYLDHHTEELLTKSTYAACTDEELVDRIVQLEFRAFDQVQNEGGRASCQNNWPVFRIMRMSQYLTWNREMLMQYFYDFEREYRLGHNLITEKYGRMMESTAPDRYAELAPHFPELSAQKKEIIEQIVAIQMDMLEAFGAEYPKTSRDARNFHSYEDSAYETSYETYLRGEISTYSDKMLQLYAGFVITCAREGINIAKETIGNTVKLYGYPDLAAYEAHLGQ
ncbi:MAG: DUF4125 family protein [Lachnospiraceae bacterium]